jgi:hypothetical protein
MFLHLQVHVIVANVWLQKYQERHAQLMLDDCYLEQQYVYMSRVQTCGCGMELDSPHMNARVEAGIMAGDWCAASLLTAASNVAASGPWGVMHRCKLAPGPQHSTTVHSTAQPYTA